MIGTPVYAIKIKTYNLNNKYLNASHIPSRQTVKLRTPAGKQLPIQVINKVIF